MLRIIIYSFILLIFAVAEINAKNISMEKMFEKTNQKSLSFNMCEGTDGDMSDACKSIDKSMTYIFLKDGTFIKQSKEQNEIMKWKSVKDKVYIIEDEKTPLEESESYSLFDERHLGYVSEESGDVIVLEI